MSTQRFRDLSRFEQGLVAIAVLLDGAESVEVLMQGKERGISLARSAKDLMNVAPEVRVPLLGTTLRSIVQD